MKSILFMLAFAWCAGAQDPVLIRVDAARSLGPWKPITGYFGYDEPNYTYTKNGRKLISELAAMSPAPVYIRAHNLLTTGDGTAALKWGSTNVYTEDAQGRPVYDWKIVDRIFDTYIQAGVKPLAEIGFMPEALSTKPQPYRHDWPKTKIEAGWAYPPKDYGKWRELIRQWVLHSVQRYGKAEVESWYWEVWNEPDIGYWQGTPAEYDKLYDYAVDGVRRALPDARVGGPASTGPAAAKASDFLNQFLQHCAAGKNYATGGSGAPLDFISYHAKGSPKVVDGRVRMGLAKNLLDVSRGMEIVSSFPGFRKLPLILSESDPEGCAACSARVYPQNAYRNGELYAAYTAEALSRIIELADRNKTNIDGMLTWAFEFEDQPYFEGFRTLATNGIDKPVLNFFRAAGMMRGERVAVESSGGLRLDEILASGVREKPDIGAVAAKSDREITVLAWNYHDDDIAVAGAPIRLTIAGLPAVRRGAHLARFLIDHDHSNAYTAWKRMGSPQNPTTEQYSSLESAGQLESLDSPSWRTVDGAVTIDFSLPRHAVSLIQFAW